jgi:hypothetical protein
VLALGLAEGLPNMDTPQLGKACPAFIVWLYEYTCFLENAVLIASLKARILAVAGPTHRRFPDWFKPTLRAKALPWQFRLYGIGQSEV